MNQFKAYYTAVKMWALALCFHGNDFNLLSTMTDDRFKVEHLLRNVAALLDIYLMNHIHTEMEFCWGKKIQWRFRECCQYSVDSAPSCLRSQSCQDKPFSFTAAQMIIYSKTKQNKKFKSGSKSGRNRIHECTEPPHSVEDVKSCKEGLKEF